MMYVRPSWFSKIFTSLLIGLVSLAIANIDTCHAQGCPSQRAVDRLLDCEYCHYFKELFNAAKWYHIELKTYNISNGVILELSGEGETAATLIHRLADKLWLQELDSEPTEKCCRHCQKRWSYLLQAQRNGALTDTGAIITITSRDSELVEWLQGDARSQEKLLSQINESH